MHRNPRFPTLRSWPIPPEPPLSLATAPRPWLSRGDNECAFPVNRPIEGEEWSTRSCCNPCGAATYCEAHRALMLRRNEPGESRT